MIEQADNNWGRGFGQSSAPTPIAHQTHKLLKPLDLREQVLWLRELLIDCGGQSVTGQPLGARRHASVDGGDVLWGDVVDVLESLRLNAVIKAHDGLVEQELLNRPLPCLTKQAVSLGEIELELVDVTSPILRCTALL